MGEIKISVIVPIYNVENYLEQCLVSLSKQTLDEIEYICIDDGSTDNSPMILDYFKSDKRFRIVHKTNEGYGKTMNLGLEMATGQYIGIVESDDYVSPDMFAQLYSYAKKNNCDFVKGDYIAFSKDGQEVRHVYRSCLYNQVFGVNENLERFECTNMSIWTGIYKKEFLKKNNIKFQETAGASFQDIGFMFKVFVSMTRGLFIEQTFLFYRTDNAGSSVKDNRKIYCVCDEISECSRYLTDCKKEIFMPFLVKIAYIIYNWNIKRITIQNVPPFLQRISEEYRKWILDGYYNSKLFDTNERIDFECIAQMPEHYSYDEILKERMVVQSKQNYFYYTMMIEIIKKYNDIYIYGTGKISNLFVQFLNKNGYAGKINYIVTKKNDEKDDVFEVADCQLDRNKIVFVAVKDNYYRIEILDLLYSSGYQNVVVLDDNMIGAIRKVV